MIKAICSNCNHVGRYNSKYYTISELQRHVDTEIVVGVVEKDQCIHDLTFEEEEEDHEN